MSIGWSNTDVRVYAADGWVSLAPRFATAAPTIVDKLEAILSDPSAAVRLQVAQNLQVISVAAPERMWEMGQRIASQERSCFVLMEYLNRTLRRFSYQSPDRCEAILSTVKLRIDNAEFDGDQQGLSFLQKSLGNWTAQLFPAQGREMARSWLDQWANNPERFGDALSTFFASLRGEFFGRYRPGADVESRARCDRAQESLAIVLTPALRISHEAWSTLASNADEADKAVAGQRYSAAEKIINHAVSQLYFGSGARAENQHGGTFLPDAEAKHRFLVDYAELLSLLRNAREPSTLHYLIELYEFLIPGDPIAVFEAIHAILLGRGEEEGYHYESLGNSAVVRIIQRYIADHRPIFENDTRRAQLVEILQLFSQVGWTDALRLLYDLPDLLR